MLGDHFSNIWPSDYFNQVFIRQSATCYFLFLNNERKVHFPLMYISSSFPCPPRLAEHNSLDFCDELAVGCCWAYTGSAWRKPQAYLCNENYDMLLRALTICHTWNTTLIPGATIRDQEVDDATACSWSAVCKHFPVLETWDSVTVSFPFERKKKG